MKNLGMALGTLFISFALSACGSNNDSSSAGSGSGGNSPGNGALYNPSGDFSYDFKTTFNGTVCYAGAKDFGQFADYCHALTDPEQNRDPKSQQACAESSRKDLFAKDCAPHGYTWPANTVSTPTPTPSASPSSPNPTPNPIYYPTPTPGPSVDPRPAVIQDLERSGIKVTIDTDPLHPLPGEMTFNQKLDLFLKVLGAHESLILERKTVIKEVHLANYSAYLSKYDILTLGVDLSESDFITYFKLFDRHLALEKSLGITLDFGVETSSSVHGDAALNDFSNSIQFFETNQSAIQSINHLIKNLSFESRTDFTLFNQTLTLDSKNYQKDLTLFINQYSFANPVFQWADQSGIEISGDIHVTDSPSVFKTVIDQIGKNETALLFLKNNGLLKTIDIKDGGIPYFSDFNKTFELASSGAGLNSNSDLISAAAYEKQLENTMHIQINNNIAPSKYLEYLIAINRVHRFETAIRAKNKFIKTITFDLNSSSFDTNLTVGYQDSDDAFLKALNEIH